MSVARLARDKKRQLGQFLTPHATAAAIVNQINLLPCHRVLEPSFGEGSFVFALIDSLKRSVSSVELRRWCKQYLFGCELDSRAYQTFLKEWRARRLGPGPDALRHCDFFTWMPPGCHDAAALNRSLYFGSRVEFFDLILGNPPFGASIDPAIQDDLDAILGFRDGRKVKKETYAFFIVKCIDMLKPGGRLVFICSDTLLTIPTMAGLRNWIQGTCDVNITEVPGRFEDTGQNMLLLSLTKGKRKSPCITVLGESVSLADIKATPNLSWRVNKHFVRYFTGSALGDKMVASSGMTIGKNSLFLRHIVDGRIEEPYEFSFGKQKITVERELSRARLGKISPKRLSVIRHERTSTATRCSLFWAGH